MKFCTQAGCKIQAHDPGKIALVVLQQLFQFQSGNMMKRLTLTVALFVTACLQICFAAGPTTGRVIDDTGVPLPGVSITVKGTSNGVTTDNDGRFTINVPNDTDTLV